MLNMARQGVTELVLFAYEELLNQQKFYRTCLKALLTECGAVKIFFGGRWDAWLPT